MATHDATDANHLSEGDLAELRPALEVHARREYPNECCGLILVSKDDPAAPPRLRECVNAQEAYHRLDPIRFPRTARNAYFISPKELLEIERQRRVDGEIVAAIYHSHCNADAYFSEEDVAQALTDGMPLFPTTSYLVLSVRPGQPTGMKIFRWRPKMERFVSDCGETARV